MSEKFVVGQWVTCIDNSPSCGACLQNGEVYCVRKVRQPNDVLLEVNDNRRMSWNERRFKPFLWQVGKTYKTTLDGVTAKITNISGGVVTADVGEWKRRFCDKTGVDIQRNGNPSGSDAHLLPYLADEPPPVAEAAKEQPDTLLAFLATAVIWLDNARNDLDAAREEYNRMEWMVEALRTRLREGMVSDDER